MDHSIDWKVSWSVVLALSVRRMKQCQILKTTYGDFPVAWEGNVVDVRIELWPSSKKSQIYKPVACKGNLVKYNI